MAKLLVKPFVYGLMVLLLISLVKAAALHGHIYDLDLKLVPDTLVEINTTPQQQYLAKTGEYSFEVPVGEYALQAKKGELAAEEKIKVVGGGDFVFDLFLFPDFEEEDKLLSELEELSTEEVEEKSFVKDELWRYLVALVILIFAFWRIIRARKKYGPLAGLLGRRKKGREEEKEESREENLPGDGKKVTENEPGQLEEVLEVIKKHEGRIHQKELRKELLYLSEAKVSLILTELEHRGKIEKIKKGRGNVVILR